MTTANKITIFRILLVPVFIAAVLYYRETGNEWYRLGAICAFAVAAFSDGIDGYIARRYNQRSALGAVLDPLADKLLLVSGIVLFSGAIGHGLQRIPLWLTTTVIGRDAILLLGLIIVHHFCGSTNVRPHLIGKAATVLQMATVVWILLRWPEAGFRWCVWGAGACTAVSGMIYVVQGMRQLSASPGSSATPGQERKTP